jgi:uncharacterized membrane protein YccC
VLAWLRARDPGWTVLRRAARAAVVVPVNFAIGSQLIGSAPVATFAAFGSFALLLFAIFPGSLSTRIDSYLVLVATGAVLITIGTLVATPDWLAVLAMAVVGFAVLFAGVISSMLNAGTQAALLTFILAVMLPGTTSDLPARLGGWGLAAIVSVPVAVLLWPPTEQNVVRTKAAAVCRALAAMLALEPPPPGSRDRLVVISEAARELRTAFRTSAAHASAIGTAARLSIRLVDELEWLTTIVTNACADAPEGWSGPGRQLRTVAAEVLEECAASLAGPGDHRGEHDPAALTAGLAALAKARVGVTDEAVRRLRAGATRVDGDVAVGELDRPLYSAHELGYAVALCAGTVTAIAAANARSWWARLLGRQSGVDEIGTVAVAQRAAFGHLDRHSVWLQNSIRGAVGLALAVVLARVFDAQNAFWIGLGALSVLRTSATATGATIARALVGTALGFAIGGAVVAAVGTNHAVLWTLLPLVILASALAPAVIPFIAGQAAFTVFSIILFNIIAPAGWRIGVFRVEDVALGCLASLVAGVLFWPRGAGAALGAALADAYGASAAYLRAAIAFVTGGGGAAVRLGAVATAAGSRLDDALRQYLADKGAKVVSLESVAALANGATRLRLAGMAIATLPTLTPDGSGSVGSDGRAGGDGNGRLAEPINVLTNRAEEVTSWYAALADGFDHTATLPDVRPSGESFLQVVLPAVDRCGDADLATRAEQLLWSGQYLGDVSQLRSHLVEPSAQVIAARSRSWWRR